MKTKNYFLILILSIFTSTAWGQKISLLKDINKGTADAIPEYLTEFNNKIYFAVNDGIHGIELWETDGTEKNTKLVVDINPNGDANVRSLVVFNNKLYFAADDGTNGLELWESDGTSAGTMMVKDIYNGGGGSDINHLAVYGGKIYFQARDNGTSGNELWESDGTTAGTKLFMNINATADYTNSNPENFTIYNGKLYFTANDGINGTELWSTDGKGASTQMVKNINEKANGNSSPSDLIVYNNKLYFAARDESSIGFYGRELWETDGTEAGTKLTKDIRTGFGDSSPSNFVVYNNKLYFSASEHPTGQPNSELWVSDGTDAGTFLITDLNGLDFLSSNPKFLTVYNNKFYFQAFASNEDGAEIWSSDGTAINTVLTADINKRKPNSGATSNSFPDNFIVYKNLLFFTADNGTNGREIFFLNPIQITTTQPGIPTKTTANLGGSIDSEGASTVTERGIVYSTENKELKIGRANVIKEEMGAGSGSYFETLTLNQGTTYYYRAYAINNEGSVYGDTYLITTYADVPTVKTNEATNTTNSGTTLNGHVTDEGDSPIATRGFVYSLTNTTPTLGESDVTNRTDSSGSNSFNKFISASSNFTYFYRAYAINNEGIGYGEVKKFTLNNALHFNGGDDKVTINDNANFNFSNGITIEAWIKVDNLNTNHTIIRQNEAVAGGKAFDLQINILGNFRFEVSTDGSNEEFFIANNPAIFPDEWHHVAVTYDGTTMRVYLDGLNAGSHTVTGGGAIFNTTSNIIVGEALNVGDFKGAIDELRIWNKALTQQEVREQKDVRLPDEMPNLIAYYNFNHGYPEGNNTAIPRITDAVNNLHGNLSGFALTGNTSNFVSGVTNTFTNRNVRNVFNASGNWSDPNNWSSGIVPSQTDEIIISNGQTVTIDVDDLVVDEFTLETGATLSIPNDKEITVQHSFNSEGILDLNSDENSSGVLFIQGTAEGDVVYRRGGLKANKWHIVTPPISGQKIDEFVNNPANNIRSNANFEFAVGTYDDNQPTDKWQYYDGLNPDPNIEFIAGQSYAISKVTDGFVTFTGTLNVENLNKTVLAGKWNAIGNPFTTYYPANKNGDNSFLNENFALLDDAYKSLYMWDIVQNKYIAVTEVDAKNRSLPPGQGFFVKLKSGETNVQFNKDKRSVKPASGTTNFGKGTQQNPSIELLISNKSNSVKTTILYFENTTKGFDVGYDIANFDGSELDVYSRLIEGNNDTNFTIQSLSNDDFNETIIPIGVKAKANTEITFSSIKTNLPSDIDVYLEDKELQTFIKLDENTSHKISLQQDLDGIGRFFLHTSSKALSVESNNLLGGIHFFHKNNLLTINGITNGKAQLKIYSVLGKKIMETSFKGAVTNIIKLPILNTGVYVVQLSTQKGELNKKLILGTN